MTETKPATGPKQTITPHLVVRGAAAASQWYQRALGAEEHGRIPVPGGRFMQIELRLGDSTVMIADEFPTWASSRRCRSEAPWARLPSTPRTWTRSGSEPCGWGPGLGPAAGDVLGRPPRGELRPLRPPLGARISERKA